MSDSGNQRIYREYGCDYCKQIKASVRVRPGGANLCRECWLEPDREQISAENDRIAEIRSAFDGHFVGDGACDGACEVVGHEWVQDLLAALARRQEKQEGCIQGVVMTCPTCHCQTHSAPQTWTRQCSKCGGPKYPYSTQEPPEPYVCSLCSSGSGRGERLREAYRTGKRVPTRPRGSRKG